MLHEWICGDATSMQNWVTLWADTVACKIAAPKSRQRHRSGRRASCSVCTTHKPRYTRRVHGYSCARGAIDVAERATVAAIEWGCLPAAAARHRLAMAFHVLVRNRNAGGLAPSSTAEA
jgi:hypothetical protein